MLPPFDLWRHHDGGEPTSGTSSTSSASSNVPPQPPPPPPAPPSEPPRPTDPPSPTPPPPPAASGTPPAPAQPASPPAAPQSFEQWLADPVNAEHVKKLRDENASTRIKLRDAEATRNEERKQLAQLLGLEGATPDPAKLAEQLRSERDAMSQELRQLRVDNALGSALTKHGADSRLTRAVLLADGTLGNLDPSAADFPAALEAAVMKAVTDYPALKVASQEPAPQAPPPAAAAAPAPPVSGGQFNGPGAPNGPVQLTQEQLKGMTPDQIDAARKAGQLIALGVGKPT